MIAAMLFIFQASGQDQAMPKGKMHAGGWAEERLCDDWKSSADRDDPTRLEAEALEKRNALMMVDDVRAESPPVSSQRLTGRIFGWLSGKDRAPR
jgi:hypothetical protein